jgi:hypothetical protein
MAQFLLDPVVGLRKEEEASMTTNHTGRAIALALVPLWIGLAGLVALVALVALVGSRPVEATALAYIPKAPVKPYT